ncbi:hypothetical protein J7E24_01665 [Hymenobacter sp. ISL-91]|uniref:hypothetical protein n=1 Tax=Hymenobacter sp. ISL-91 TaxID=2819151 RepID=UPI001BE86EB8|nr:hypothetical protein [Hymenobacter sp. ISL-91]MBT2556485.1 hypothetical protein [Hymenobacter sp. ISL-91]
MPSSAASARRFLISCCAAVGLLAAAGGCRSGQSAYQFRPGPAVAHAPRPTAATQPPPAVAPVPAAAKVEAPVARPSVAVRLVRRAPAHRSPVPPKHLAKRLPQMGRLAYGAALQPVRRRAGTTDGVQAVAEVGLGTTVLGVLGLVVGPISLIGLLIWGGPVWAVLLGLSALAVLVAYIDPFR